MRDHEGPVWAVAVSGGGDSLALMHLLKDHAQAHGLPAPIVLTVDHGLRKEAAKDARRVAAWAKQAGLKAHVLTWRGARPKAGIEAAAREARYRLMGAWLVKHRIAALFVGHTEDDQAETFLLRLARGSGLDGLSAMRAVAPWPVPSSKTGEFETLSVRRPLLSFRRDDLRAWLTSRGQDWLDDPMNDDAAFDRVKIRKAQAALAEAGLTSARIAAAAAHLARARTALEVMTQAVLARAAQPVTDGVLLDVLALTAAPREVGLRALAAVLMEVSHRAYRPRFEALERLFDGLMTGRPATLHGCHIAPVAKKPALAVARTWLVEPENPRKTGGSVKSGKSAKRAGRVAARA